MNKFLSKGETLIFIGILIGVFIISGSLDFTEIFLEFAHNHEQWELDELVVTFALQSIVIFVFLLRKIKQLRINVKRREKTEKLLRFAMKEKNRIYGIIAHDLTSPFNSIIGYSDYLLNKYNSISLEKKMKMIGQILDTGKNAHDLLNNLLEWSSNISGKNVFYPRKYNLNELIGNSISIINDHAKNKKIKLNIDIPEELTVYCDERMMWTILRNLLTNAIKFTHRGGDILLSASQNESNTEIIVSDSGVGIKPENLKKLFGEDIDFSTVGTEDERGTGLGLMLCKEFVERHEGKITVESEFGKGTKFKVLFPLNAAVKVKT